MLPKSNRNGFTILEAVIGMLLAAGGLAMVYQSLGGAARLQTGAMELTRTQIVATSVLANASQSQDRASSGISDGIAWTVLMEPVAFSENGTELIRFRVLASGPSGREVVLLSEKVRQRP